MTMTPARAASIFGSRKPGEHGDQGKEALPWWSFALFGGLATAWLLPPILGRWLGLPAGEERGESAPGGLKATLLLVGDRRSSSSSPARSPAGRSAGCIIRPVNWVLGWFFRGFNWVFERATQVYGKTVGWCLRLSAIVLLVYVGLLGLTGFGFTRVPGGFIPIQDKGYLVVNIQLPDSASLERTVEVTDAVEKIALETPGVAHTVGHPGDVVRPERQQLELRQHVRHPQAVPRAARARARPARPIAASSAHRLRREVPEAQRARLRRPGGRGPGQRRRLQADGGGHRRRRLRRAAGPGGQPGRQGQPAARPRRPVQRLPRRHAAALRGRRPRQRSRRWGWRSPTSSTRCRRTWAATTSTTSTASAAPGRSTSRPTPPSAPTRRPSSSSRSATPTATWCRWARWRGPRLRRAGARSRATTCSRRRRSTAPRCPASAPATSSRRWRALADQELPRNMTSEWTELSYLQKQAEQDRAVPRPAAEPVQRLRAGGGAGLLRAGRPVRELVAAAGGDPGRADVPAERAGGRRPGAAWTSTSSCRSASWCWSAWRARTPS